MADKATRAALDLVAAAPTLLSTNLATDLNGLLQGVVKGGATIYDKAMDAQYLATNVGGTYHRMFDGGHTVWGAITAGRSASADDSFIQEAAGTVQGLLRDATTPMGLPLANWDKETFDQVATSLQSKFNIPRDWFYDLNSYDAAELLSSSIGVLALALSWSRAETEDFARLAGGMGVSAVVSANPLLLVVTVVSLAKAFHNARRTGEYAELVDGQFRGAAGAGATLAAVSLVGAAGGPAGVALLTGLTAGILVNKASKKVSVVEISRFMVENVAVAASEAKKLASEHGAAIVASRTPAR